MESIASHIAGAEITYKHLYNNTYKFQLKVYRDCGECKFNNSGGGDNTNNCNDVPNLIIKGALGTSYSNNQFGTIEIVRNSIKDITNACVSNRSKCQTNSNMAYGYEEHLFEGIYDFSTLIKEGYCQYDISISLSSRSVNINNQMSEQNFFNFTMLNLCEGINNESVEFKNAPLFIHELNQSNYSTLGSINSDNDSLVFKLKPALVNRNLSVSYALGRNSDAPFSYYCLSGLPNCTPNISGPLVEGVYCSKQNGDFAFTPIQNNQGGVVVIECEEWKKNSNSKYYLAGVVRRDVYSQVINSNNIPPKIKNSKLNYTICENSIFTEEILLEDIPVSGGAFDTVFLDLSTSMKGAHLEQLPINSPPYFKYNLIVDPKQNNPGTYSIGLIARDNHCPGYGVCGKTLTIEILDSRDFKLVKNVKNCGQLELYSSNFARSSLFWTIKDENDLIIAQEQGRKLITQLPSGGDFKIEVFVPEEKGYCAITYQDTIRVNDFKKADMKFNANQVVCENSKVILNPEKFQTYDKFELFANGVKINGFPFEYLADKANQTIEFKVQQSNGCITLDQVNIDIHPSLVYSVNQDTICLNGIFPNKVSNIKYDKNDVKSINYNYLSSYSTLNQLNAVDWETQIITPKAHIIELYSFIQDNHLCVYQDTTQIHIVEPDPININCVNAICKNSPAILLQTKNGGSWECVDFPVLVNNNQLNPKLSTTNSILLKYTETKRCLNSQTFTIQIVDTTPIIFNQIGDLFICESEGDFVLKASPSGGYWTGTYVSDSIFNTNAAAGKSSEVIYTYENINTCVSESRFNIHVEKLPALKLIADKSKLCVGDILNLQALSSIATDGYWYTDGDGEFDKQGSVITSYKPSSNDVNTQKINFTYTLQTNGTCGNVSSEISASVKKGPTGEILKSYPVSVCEPAAITFTSNYKRLEKQYWYINDSLIEEFDYNFDFKTVLNQGDYVIKTKVYDSTCNALAISELIHVYPKPNVKMMSNPAMKISREYPRMYLRDRTQVNKGHSVNWYFNDLWIGDQTDFYYQADDNRDSFYIKLVATGNEGSCKDSIKHLFVFIPINQLFIPDAFSPDSKGPEANNVFKVQGPPMKVFELEIYNRFGEKVFMTQNMDEAWDGKYKNVECALGVYFYKIISTDYEGISRDYSGTVTIIR
ncbi:MAG: gliding motility-associated C-terminal domain-containing protein [Bacteroidia bacterium]